MESVEPLSVLKNHCIEQTTAPLDGMWLFGFVPTSSHFGIFDAKELIGFFCVNEQGYLLQFHLSSSHQNHASQFFEFVVKQVDLDSPPINGAFVSTAEPQFLSLCLDQFSNFKVNALMYEHDGLANEELIPGSERLIKIESTQLEQAVKFAVDSIGAPAEWLSGYYANLIERQELYGIWKNERLIATGESRNRDEVQTEWVDVGMIVAKAERGRGLATNILRQLVAMNSEKGLKSICSTESSNIAAQKAIARAGFCSRNRIIEFT